MLFDILQTIADFVVLLTRLTTEDLADEQRMALIGQFIHLQGLEALFQFDLHDLLMILITILINIFWRAWDSADRWPYR
jgi:flagellar biosynthesis protein FliR